MTNMPPRIARLPRDKRGYPIPWNVLRDIDDKPVFTVNDQLKHFYAIAHNLCPICGEPLGRWKWFVGGILSAFDPHGAYYDLPGHKECESYALQTCPYLALPQYLGRIDVPDPSRLPDDIRTVNITMMPERPEVFVAVASEKAEIVALHGSGTPTMQPLRPYLDYQFWRHGKQLTTEEALPLLRERMGQGWTLPAIRP